MYCVLLAAVVYANPSGYIPDLLISFSNFEKYYYNDFHRAQCTESTPFAIDNFRRFPSNSTKISVVIEYVVGYSFLCKISTTRCHGKIVSMEYVLKRDSFRGSPLVAKYC